MFIIWLCWLFRFRKDDRELEVRTATYGPVIDQSQHAKSVSHIIMYRFFVCLNIPRTANGLYSVTLKSYPRASLAGSHLPYSPLPSPIFEDVSIYHIPEIFISCRYLEGGVESGFRKVDRDAYQKRLFHVKGKRNIRVSQVRVSEFPIYHTVLIV